MEHQKVLILWNEEGICNFVKRKWNIVNLSMIDEEQIMIYDMK